MQQQLAAVVCEFEEMRTRIHQISTDTPDARWNARRDALKWSVAECIQHLSLTSDVYIPMLQAVFAQHNVREPIPKHYRRDTVGWLLGIAVGPLPRIGKFRFGRVPTTPAFTPAGALDRASVMSNFDSTQDAMIAVTRSADGLPLEAMQITSPFNARARYNAYSCLVLLPRHQLRHVRQAEEIWANT